MTVHRLVLDKDGKIISQKEVVHGYAENVFLNPIDPNANGQELTRQGRIEIGSPDLLRFFQNGSNSPEVYVGDEVNSMLINQGVEGSITTDRLLDRIILEPQTIKFVWSEKER